MDIEEVTRLRTLVEQEPDPEIKALARAALFAILGAPVDEQKRKRRQDEREETRFQLGIAGLVLGAVFFGSLLAVGAIAVSSAAFGVIAGGVMGVFASLLGVPLPKLPTKRGD